ncbi:tetratricopeptide repeat protein, partial [bacterium]|nr:tetratricopeptide repeat protein [bacterium]
EKALRAAFRESPQDARVLRRLGDTLVRYGKPEEAVELYRAHLRTAPVSPVIHAGLAIALACSGRVDDGVAALTAPAHPFAVGERQALGLIGTALIEHEQGQATTTLYRRVLESDPRNVDALVNLGAVALGAGKPDEAAEYLKRALAASPACVDAMGSLANTFVKRRRPAEAEGWYRKAVAEDPYHSSAHAALALHLARQGRVAEGIEHARRCVHLNPAFVPGYRALALLYRMRGTPALSRQSQELASLFLPE